MEVLSMLVFSIAFSFLVGAIAAHFKHSMALWTILSLLFSPLLAGIILAIVILISENKK